MPQCGQVNVKGNFTSGKLTAAFVVEGGGVDVVSAIPKEGIANKVKISSKIVIFILF